MIATCKNANAAFVHGLSDAMHDGTDTFAEFSPCKCEVCKRRYSSGWMCGEWELQERNDGSNRSIVNETVDTLLARIQELEEKLGEVTK